MKILLTGASGIKVAATVARLLAHSHHVIGLDRVAAPTTHILTDITSVDWRAHLVGVDAILHFAALHAPHRVSHAREEFVRTNVDATRNLLAAARDAGVTRVVLASTTSVYGRAMRTPDRAAWVTETLTPIAEDIYDETKLAAEALCRDAYAPDFVTMALRFSRSFPEPTPEMALYRLYRGIDARDVAQAFSLALDHTPAQFEAFNISAATPFLETDCEALKRDAASVIETRAPEFAAAFAARGWPLPKSIDRVYVIEKAARALGFKPEFGWQSALL